MRRCRLYPCVQPYAIAYGGEDEEEEEEKKENDG